MKRIIITGASSGIGRQVAQLFINRGDRVAVVARRIEPLQALQQLAPDRVVAQQLDVTCENAPAQLEQLAQQLGGVDIYLHAAGVGWRNNELDEEKELTTMQTNVMGFTRMVGAVYRFMAQHGGGQIACISSIAGTKGMGAAPAYSASKALQNTYIEALQQQANARGLNIRFTDIRPGFVNTALLDDDHHYPLLMKPDCVARHIVHAIDQHCAVAVIDWRWSAITWVWRHAVPHALWRRLPVGLR